MKKKKVYLTLQNGKVFQGWQFGAEGDASGELVFSTGMVGYMENLTDPANYGKMIVQTFPLIGNYGAIRADAESNRVWASAYVVREICDEPSNFRMEDTLENYLKEEGVVGICGVDTRELTKILREEGSMNARISVKPLKDADLKALAVYKTENALQAVVPQEKGYFAAENGTKTVVLWNLGAKNSTIANLNAQGYHVISVPANTTAEEILSLNANGVVISDGAGDPNENTALIAEVAKLMGKTPVMAIGLGHLTVALAMGAKVEKQALGHRGSNQPVKSLKDGKVYISMQNHSYEVVSGSIKQGEISFVNVNDGSCEGIDYADLNAFTVQFVPESCGIGHPENPLYDRFATMTEVK